MSKRPHRRPLIPLPSREALVARLQEASRRDQLTSDYCETAVAMYDAGDHSSLSRALELLRDATRIDLFSQDYDPAPVPTA